MNKAERERRDQLAADKIERRKRQDELADNLIKKLDNPEPPDRSVMTRLELRREFERIEDELFALLIWIDHQYSQEQMAEITFQSYMKMGKALSDAQ